ncbi:hypothetical protein Tco_0892933 [Tanacetum coccineum]|uniref:Uncharacterized protein n=1 Tax=Tanacetum coccineum TaxID=301880 RepID=A0ABQ5CAJ6_9ASTR
MVYINHSGRANNKVVLALTSFLLFCMSSVVIATVLPFFFAEASPATAFPGSSGVSRIGSFVEFSQQALIPLVVPKLGSYALGYKVIVILDKHKVTMRETLLMSFTKAMRNLTFSDQEDNNEMK